MKKLTALLLAGMMVLSLAACGEKKDEEPSVDSFTSASVADFYGDYGLTGDELMNALNSFQGSYLVSTVNPDGSPNIGFYIYGCVKHYDTYYLQLGLADNQTKQNLERTGKGMAAYAAAPDAEKGYSMAGARMTFTVVTDEALIAELQGDSTHQSMYGEITEVRSLG